MSSASFVPNVWGQALSRVAKSCASPFFLLTGAFVAFSVRPAQAADRIEGQILVRTSALASGLASIGGTVSAQSVVRTNALIQSALSTKLPGSTLRKNFAISGWTLVKIPAGMSTDASLSQLKASLGADNVAPDQRLYAKVVPNDPLYGSQYWLNKIAAPSAWDITHGSNSVIVAVIDSGAQLNHPDLKDNLWRNTQEIPNNGKDDDGDGYIDDVNGINAIDNTLPPEDDDGHGTFCAGVVGASTNNNLLVAGVNWNVQVMPLRFIGADGSGDVAGAIECLEYVIAMKKRGENIRVTSNSWGADPSDPTGGGSTPLKNAFQAAGQAGILNVIAAGNGDVNNNGFNIDLRPQYPASYPDDSIIAVAASDENDNPTYFTNYGATSVDLAAPGNNILGLDLASSVAYETGTSMSTPMVAGAAALLLSKEGNLSAADVKARILNTVDKLPQWAGKTVTGGRLNLLRMLTNAANGLPTVSGTITHVSGGSTVPLVGVTVTLKPTKGSTTTVTTGPTGIYSFPNLSAGTYTITPKLSGFTFTAQTIVLTASSSDTTVNFVGISKKKTYSLSGHATGPDNLPRQNIQIFQTSGKNVTLLAVTDANGNYIVYDRPQGTYRLTAVGGEAGLEWIPQPSALNLPTKVGATAPNGIVNFVALPPDFEAPTVTIPSPANNSSVKVGSAPKVTIVATDRSGVNVIYYKLTNSLGIAPSFYNWQTKKWTANSLEAGVTAFKDVKGTSVSLSVTLPKLLTGSYQFQAWASDDKGNTTPAGSEATLNLFVGVAATSVHNS